MTSWQRHREIATDKLPDPQISAAEDGRMGSVSFGAPDRDLMVWVESYDSDGKRLEPSGSVTVEVVEALQDGPNPGGHQRAPTYYASVGARKVMLGRPTKLDIGAPGRYILRVSGAQLELAGDDSDAPPVAKTLRVFTRSV